MRSEEGIREQINNFGLRAVENPEFRGILQTILYWVLDDGTLEARQDKMMAVREAKDILGGEEWLTS